jgi:hypothetical protein
LIKIKFFFSLVSLLFIALLKLEANNIFDKGVEFKEGVVHYSVSGSEKGIKLLYIKDYGKYRVIYTDINNKFMRKEKNIKKITYITPKWYLEVDPQNGNTIKFPNLKYLLQQRLLKLPLKDRLKVVNNFQKLHKNSISNLKGKVYPKAEKILNHICNKEIIDGITNYTAENFDLVLKSETHILGYHSESIATHIEKRTIDPKIFEIPKDLNITSDPKKIIKLEKKADEIISYLQNPSQNTSRYKLTIKGSQKEDFHKIIQDSIKALEAL